jgi:hypothetical protein
MSSQLATKLSVSGREIEEDAKKKEQAEVTVRINRMLLPSMSSRLVTKLSVSG